MRKTYISLLVLCMIVLAACSSDDGAEEQNESDDIEESAEAQDVPEPESIFIQEFSKDDKLDFTGLTSSADASTILFTLVEEIKRDSTRERHIIYGDNEPMNMKELSEATAEDLDGRLCRNTFVSPNGKYVTFTCVSDEDWFVIYDTEAEEVVHQVEEPEEYSTDVIGITNDLDILRYNQDTYTISIKNAETDEKREFDLIEWSGQDDFTITEVLPTDDGKQFLVYSHAYIYLLDTETETLEKVVDVEMHQERLQNKVTDITIGTVKFSPNGKYLFYRIGDASDQDFVYSSGNFLNLETGETLAYADFDYDSGTIDNEGNVVLRDNDETFLYNIDNQEVKRVPFETTGTYVKRVTLVADGNTLLYADRIRSSDETPAYELFRLDVSNKEKFEAATLDAELEDTEALIDGASGTSGEGFALHPIEVDVKELIAEVWQKSAEVPFITEFPEVVESSLISQGEYSYRQRVRLDPEEVRTDRKNISYQAKTYPDIERNNLCIDDDLELTDTIDGVDYYFFLFSNGDAEIAFVENDWCYTIEGKGFTKEEMFAMVDSVEILGKQPEQLPIDDVKFPQEMPTTGIEITRTNDVERSDGTHDFFVTYRGDDGVTIDFEASVEQPQHYDHDDAVSVDMDNGMEGSFYESNERLFVFDGTYYYTIISKIDDEVVQAAGGKEQMKEALIQIGNALE